MTIFKEFSDRDFINDFDVLEQLVDIVQSDISSSVSRKTYQVWVTGGVGPGVTSSLFQTVFDQDFTLQTANAMFDITVGLSPNSSLVSGAVQYTDPTTGKQYFPSQSLMMREKTDLYRSFAQTLLGDATAEFKLYTDATTYTNIREPMFLCFKRLIARDGIKRESFGIRLFGSGTSLFNEGAIAGQKIYTDASSSAGRDFSFAGETSTIVDSTNTANPVGILFIDKGVAVIDTTKVFDQATSLSGPIDAVNAGGTQQFSGNFPRFLVSASIDDICNHICQNRFSSSNQAAIAFENETRINSQYFICRFEADEFNYSSNPTYVDSSNRIVVIEPGQEDKQRSFTFITGVGGYDANDQLLWVAKLSRPALKNRARAFPLQVRLDY